MRRSILAAPAEMNPLCLWFLRHPGEDHPFE
jgi:hypothetical protein